MDSVLLQTFLFLYSDHCNKHFKFLDVIKCHRLLNGCLVIDLSIFVVKLIILLCYSIDYNVWFWMEKQVNWNQTFAVDVSQTFVKEHVYSMQNLHQSLKRCDTWWLARGFTNVGSTTKEKLKIDPDRFLNKRKSCP